MLDQFLDGSRYISGVWRILDSWGNVHSVISGKGPLGWFYGYASFKPANSDFTYVINYLEGITEEVDSDRIINDTISALFINTSNIYKKEFNIDNPPTLIRKHYFEIRSSDPDRIRSMLDLAISIPFTAPI